MHTQRLVGWEGAIVGPAPLPPSQYALPLRGKGG
jgi:hypothetical protein